MTDQERRAIAAIFKKTGGMPWEPRDYRHPLIKSAIDAGYLRWVDGRCGFERFKDSMLAFTDAGRIALQGGYLMKAGVVKVPKAGMIVTLEPGDREKWEILEVFNGGKELALLRREDLDKPLAMETMR